MHTARNLMKARELLDRAGWCKGHSTNSKGQHCLARAIEVALTHPSLESMEAKNATLLVLDGMSIVYFNDAYDTTREDVDSTLDAATSLALYEMTLEEADRALQEE